jgi:hypothetical protein
MKTRTDTERLDWIVAKGAKIEKHGLLYFVDHDSGTAGNSDYRNAIDFAMLMSETSWVFGCHPNRRPK